ncbi:colicin E3/pyocin S6 family cytotoxin [Pseudomonas tensinigenes]|uniref:colicin E3/pyocin S6 family cytotoxin n=1 Tax=Pseudomonas tensinigenes TaxID=2745511 RepID=UPI003F5A01CE
MVGIRSIPHPVTGRGNYEVVSAFPGLKKAQKLNPIQEGGGLRERWKNAKGRRIYEWDSMHGELEVYRASDGTHLGAFDPFTGERREDPKDERSIRKKYL